MNRWPAGALLLAFLVRPEARADDWPMAGADSRRSGHVERELPADLALRWTYQAAHAPMPAWPASDRQPFDRAFHPVVAGGLLYFGSSADGKIHALDAATGKDRWSFFTGGPCRFAPAVGRDRLFAVSDDGHVYCLKSATGELLWKARGGPNDRMILGNDRMISRWPARGGPLLVDDVVYFAAGIWPSDGIYLYALDAETGRVRWCNDQSGSIAMPQPHGGANAESGVAAQGDLVMAGDLLLVPTGRAVPAAFDRADGKFRYFHLQQNGHKGGSTALAVGMSFINSGCLFDAPTGVLLETVGPGAVAVFSEGIVRSTDKELVAAKFVDKQKPDRKGGTIRYRGLEKLWSIADVPGGKAVIAAGHRIVVAGPGKVTVVDAAARNVVRSFDIEGTPYSLAVAGDRLYAATDAGRIHCFASAAEGGAPTLLKPSSEALPHAEDGFAAAAAKEILEKSGVTEGFCADLGCGDGALALELARRTRLQICAVDADPENVARARRRLDAAGLYGVRVTVHQADPKECPFPRFFANLVVSGRSLSAGAAAVPPEAVLRVQRPFGGTACLGKPGAMEKSVRGPLLGAGRWTHQYADAANTSCSGDDHVRGPLTMHWFRDSDFDMPQRHGRGPAPLFFEGRLFVEGLHGIRAVDAYNGRPLWDVALPEVLQPFNAEHLMGASGTGSNMCVAAEGLYVQTGRRCLRLDPATGRKLAEFEPPSLPGGKPGTWGYLACEGGILFGSLVNDAHVVKWRYGKSDMSRQFTESAVLFALDAVTGKPRWSYAAASSLRHNAVAIAGGRVFLIDRPTAEIDLVTAEKGKSVEHPKGELVALDAKTGAVLWKSAEDVFGTVLVADVAHDALLMAYQPTAFRLPSEKGGQLAVLRASDGRRLWDKKASYSSRPVLVDRTVYAQGGGWDLLTGEERRFDLKRSYGCGQMACSAHLAVYRSATMGYHDLASSAGTTNYGGIRLGCWINAIPAGGLVLVPDATTGCQCSYLNRAWMALEPRE